MYQYERNTKLNMKFKDAFDVRETNKAVLEFVDDHIDINIPAYKGEKGDKGDPGPSPVYQYSVPSVGDLAAIAETLTEAEEGYWYGVDGSSSGWIWNGRDLVERENFIGQKGDKGDMPNLVGGVFSSARHRVARLRRCRRGTTGSTSSRRRATRARRAIGVLLVRLRRLLLPPTSALRWVLPLVM
ncbi:hypothetical protein GS532_21255 [Rhodococcus hoagii]|nr:hypothetical protein [Prescottella equi]